MIVIASIIMLAIYMTIGVCTIRYVKRNYSEEEIKQIINNLWNKNI
jgi:hypothetical protein